MAIIDVTCPDCGVDISMPAQAMLATLDLGRIGGPLGRVSWACLSCDRFITAEIEVADLLSLVSVGVLLLDDEFGASTVRHVSMDHGQTPQRPAEPTGRGAPFTSYDVGVLHDLLGTDEWLQQLVGPPDGSS
jgi:hypothetical protein